MKIHQRVYVHNLSRFNILTIKIVDISQPVGQRALVRHMKFLLVISPVCMDSATHSQHRKVERRRHDSEMVHSRQFERYLEPDIVLSGGQPLVIPCAVHFRLRPLPFFLEKVSLIAQESRCTGFAVICCCPGGFYFNLWFQGSRTWGLGSRGFSWFRPQPFKSEKPLEPRVMPELTNWNSRVTYCRTLSCCIKTLPIVY